LLLVQEEIKGKREVCTHKLTQGPVGKGKEHLQTAPRLGSRGAMGREQSGSIKGQPPGARQEGGGKGKEALGRAR